MLDEAAPLQKHSEGFGTNRPSRIRSIPFSRECIQAQRRNTERERERREVEDPRREQELKRQERDHFRKAMGRARKPGRDGQRRLGRESKLLPKMVEHLLEKLN